MIRINSSRFAQTPFMSFVAMLCCSFCIANTASASEASQALISIGETYFMAESFEKALQKFEEAGAADPAHANALVFQAAALNRLGRSSEAQSRLERATEKGARHPDIDFEMGWALVKQKQWQAGIQKLNAYEQAYPGRGKTCELLGRAYLGLGKYPEASAELDAATERNADLEETVAVYRALLKEKTGDKDGVQAELQAIVDRGSAPVSSSVRAAGQRSGPLLSLSGTSGRNEWQVSISPQVGFNNNVILLGDSIPLPSDISSQKSSYLRLIANGGYKYRISENSEMTAGCGALLDLYTDIDDVNVLDINGSLGYAHSFNDRTRASMTANGQNTRIGGDSFRQRWSARPAVSYKYIDWAIAEAAMSVATSDYKQETGAAEQNRDSVMTVLELVTVGQIPETKVTCRLGYRYGANSADGDDFDFSANGLMAGLECPLKWKASMVLRYEYTMLSYDNANTLSTAIPAEARDDTVGRIVLGLARPVTRYATARITFTSVNSKSNISFYDFDQQVLSAGFDIAL